eukprot:8168463-Karenia_brevis.AAC.1
MDSELRASWRQKMSCTAEGSTLRNLCNHLVSQKAPGFKWTVKLAITNYLKSLGVQVDSEVCNHAIS